MVNPLLHETEHAPPVHWAKPFDGFGQTWQLEPQWAVSSSGAQMFPQRC